MNQKDYLRSVFGDDWRAGMRKNPDIDRVSRRDVDEVRRKRRAEKEVRVNRILKDSIYEAKQKGVISAAQAQRMHNSLGR